MSNEQQSQVFHHWRTGSQSDYVGVEILPNGQSIIATISHIVWDENAKVQGSKKPSWMYIRMKRKMIPAYRNTQVDTRRKLS